MERHLEESRNSAETENLNRKDIFIFGEGVPKE